jgi:lysozyme
MKLKSFTNKDRYGNMTSFEFYEDSNVPMMEGIPDHPGNPKGTDTVPAWLTPGEFVMNAEATRMFEPQIEQMNNAGRAVQAQQGGTIPEYSAHGGPVYMNQGGSWLDSLLGLFADKALPEMPVATQGAVPPSDTSRDERVAALIEAGKTDGPTRPDPTMSNKMYMDFLKNKEGFRSEAYLDSAGVPTIGYGFTEGVKMGDTISEEEANKRLLREMAKTDQDYNRLVTADLNPNQQAAVKSLLYNIGGPQFANSKARAALNAGDFETFKKEAAEFRLADGKVIPGLENRRRDELELFFKPYKANRPSVENSPSAMIPAEDILARQQEVRRLQEAGTYEAPSDVGDPFPPEPTDPGPNAEMIAAQAATARDGVYNSGDNDMAGLGSDTPENAARARLLRDQQRMQQGQVPPMTTPPPIDLEGGVADGVPTVDDRSALQKFGESGGLMGFLDRNIVQPYEEGQERKRILSDQDRMQQGQVPKVKEPPKVSTSFDKDNLPDNLVLNPETGKVEFKDPSQASTLGLQNAIDGPMGAQAKAFQLRTAKEDMQKAIDNGYGPGDAIFDNAYARVQELKGADEELASLQDEKKLIFTEGELKVTDAEIEKKTIQAEQLVELGLPEAAAKVEQEVKDLKDKKGRLETQSKELTVPPVDAPPKSDADEEGDATKESKVFEVQEIINDNENTPDDNTVTGKRTPDEVEKKGGEAPPEQVNKAESFLSGILGDLFDKGELKRMAIMYVGGRMLGGSHNGSLNFAAKQYVSRVDAKVSAHDKYVKQLTKDGLYKPSSIAKYKRTKNLADLEKKDATYAATGGASLTKMIPVKGGGFKKATVVPVKNSSTGEISYRAVDGTILPAEVIANARDYRPELVPNTDEYYARRDRVYNQMEKSFAETRDQDGNYELDGNTKKYYTNVGPRKAAREFFAWAESIGQDPESTQSMDILTMAQEQMITEAKDKKFRPGSLTPYLEYQMIREKTTAPELFLLNQEEMAKGKPPKMIRMDQMQSLYQNIEHVIHSRGNKTTVDAMFAKGVQNWQALPQSERDKYNKGAEKDVGVNGFYNFMQDTMAALKAKEPKT